MCRGVEKHFLLKIIRLIYSWKLLGHITLTEKLTQKIHDYVAFEKETIFSRKVLYTR
jgi:hypothetical protein